jgi:SAM-dependent methyltransferase
MMQVADALPQIRSARSYIEQDTWIADAMREVAARAGRPLRILEAGCGNKWPIDLKGIDYRLTGADLDAAALKLRIEFQKDLDDAIHGDLCTMSLPSESFDVVYSAYVLEHIRDAEIALNNLVGALRPGGLLVIRVPDPDTARGLVTRVTPFWFHVLYHRLVMKRPLAGTPGHAPYPTHYHPVISISGMRAYARSRGLEWRAIYADTFVRDGKGIAGAVFRTGAKLIDVASLGRFTSSYNDLVYMLKKP